MWPSADADKLALLTLAALACAAATSTLLAFAMLRCIARQLLQCARSLLWRARLLPRPRPNGIAHGGKHGNQRNSNSSVEEPPELVKVRLLMGSQRGDATFARGVSGRVASTHCLPRLETVWAAKPPNASFLDTQAVA